MAEEVEVVNINSATVKDLETLFGVGRAKAEAIHNVRMVKGAFSSLEELLSVPGIGRNVLDQNKEVLVCEAVADVLMEGQEDSMPIPLEDNSGRGARDHGRVAGTGSCSGQAGDRTMDHSYGTQSLLVPRQTPPTVKPVQTPPVTKSGSQSRRSSRRSSSQQQEISTSPAAASSSSSSPSSSNTSCNLTTTAASCSSSTSSATSTTISPGSRSSRSTAMSSGSKTQPGAMVGWLKAASTTSCRNSSTSVTSPVCLSAATAGPIPSLSSTLARTRQRVVESGFCGFSLDANKSNIDPPNLNEDSSMDWLYVREASESDNLEDNRLLCLTAGATHGVGITGKSHKSVIANNTSNGYLIAGELGEAELNKLRVRENNYGEDNEDNHELYKDDDSSVGEDLEDTMRETTEEIAAALRRRAGMATVQDAVGPSGVLGSDTPYEDPPEGHVLQVGSLSPTAMDVERLRGQFIPQSFPLDARNNLSQFGGGGDNLLDGSDTTGGNNFTNSKPCTTSSITSQGQLNSGVLNAGEHSSSSNSSAGSSSSSTATTLNTLSGTPPRRRKPSDSLSDVTMFGGGSSASHEGTCSSSMADSIASGSGSNGPVTSSGSADAAVSIDTAAPSRAVGGRMYLIDDMVQGEESVVFVPGDEDLRHSDDDDLEVGLDEESEEEGEEEEDEQMIVEMPHKHKKQVKRKFEVGGEVRPLLPVKKSCKAEESCVPGGLCGSIVRRLPPAPPGMSSWLGQFSSWSPQEKLTALDSLIDVCDLNQVRHVHQIILPTFQRDFISLLPKELALYVLSFLTPRDLLKAAQTCKYWNMLTADNLLWREKCREAGIDNFLDHMDKRRKKGTCVGSLSPFKTVFMRRHHIESNWRVNPLRAPRVLKGHDDHVITCLQFSGNTIVSGSDDNTLKVWNATTSKCVRTLTGHTGGVWSSQMRDNIIVSGSTDRMLRVWDAETGECTQTLCGHTSTVRCLHLHKNIVVSGSRDATLRVWDVSTGTCNHVLVGHVAAVRCVQYNGKLVVSGAYDFMVKVWNPDTEECLHTLSGHTNRVYSLQFDGVHVVSGSLDTTIRVWDVESGTCRHTLMGHQSLTSGMELHNNILISGNADSTVKVWDIVTGQCLQTLSGSNKHRSAVTCLQFINKFVVTSSDDGTVKLWDVSTGEFVRNLVTLDTGNSGGVVWRIRASDTKLVCAVGSRNGTEETKLLVLDFDVDES